MVSGLRIQFTALRPKLAPLATPQLRAALDVYAASFAAEVIVRTQKYPPVPAGSTYIRTFTLLKSWDLKKRSAGDAIRYEIVNNARDKQVGQLRGGRGGEQGDRPYYYTRRRSRFYARWVHGPNIQAGQHAEAGWRNIGDELERLGGRGRFRDGAQAVINKHIGVR